MVRIDVRIVISVSVLVLLALSALAAPYSFGAPAVDLTADVRELQGDGLQVQSVAIEDRPSGGLALVLVLGDGERAERLDIELTSGGQRLVGHARSAVNEHVEARVYPGADELLLVLAGGGEISLEAGCSDYVVSAKVGDRYASVSEDNYYVVREAVRGPRSGARLAAILGDALAGDAELVSVQQVEAEHAVHFDLVDASHGTSVTVRAQLDDRGDVAAVELRESGGYGEVWRRYHGADRLTRALRSHRAVRALDVREGSLVLALAGGARYVLYLDDFEDQEYEGECGC